MIGEYRFFQEFFDGQIVKPESERYKLFRLMLVSCFSVFNLFFVLAGYASLAVFFLVELGMIWNFYVGLSRKISYAFSIVVAFLYFYICSQFALYSNALIYIACYIPLQLIATGRDYSEGNYVQIKKKITDPNKVLFIMFAVVIFVALYMIDYSAGARFVVLDVLSAVLLVCSAVLRNERYLEYYIFRVFALVASAILWIFVTLEFGNYDALLVTLMYIAYLVYDITEFCVQSATYESEYTIRVKEFEKEQEKNLAEEKLLQYKKIQDGKVQKEQTPKPAKKTTKKPKTVKKTEKESK